MDKIDVFLSFKNTDSTGQPTKESAMANDLYDTLTKKGINVFFSNKTLSILGVAQYKRVIDNSLDEAKVLIAVGTSRENLESSWVRYEWDSFYSDILSGKKDGYVFSYIDNMTTNDLPRTLRQLQSFESKKWTIDQICEHVISALGRRNAVSSAGQLAAPAKKSTYTYLSDNEASRLVSQAQLVCDNDVALLLPIIKKLSAKHKINVLDIGCSDGYLTRKIFNSFANKINLVVGIDIEKACIVKAQEDSSSIYKYFQIDIESEDCESELNRVLAECKIESFDLVFSSLVFHHLSDPTKLFKRLRDVIRKGGFIYIRSCDDDEIAAYPDDDGLVQSTLLSTYDLPGMSDRRHGRKLYVEAYKAGYKNIQIKPYYVTTAGMDTDERLLLYFDIFYWRKNRYKQLIELYPSNEIYLKQYTDYCRNCDEIEDRFLDPSFYFRVAGPILIATK